MSEWIRVKDRLPEVGRLVLICDGTLWVMAGNYSGRDSYSRPRWWVNGGRACGITHWQEMPEPPETYTTDGITIYYNGIQMTPEYITSLLNQVEKSIDKLAG